MTKPPTAQQMMDRDGLTEVHRTADDCWRHGSRIFQVFRRESDDTFWAASYDLQTDGEYNGLREGDATIEQVAPHERTTTTTIYQPLTT